MDMTAPDRMDIDRDALEERIAELSDALERCRKISLAAKITMAVGGVYLAAILVGLAPALPSTTIAAIAAVLGGIVLLGSNASTWAQTEAALAAVHAARASAQAEALDAAFETLGRPALHIVGEQHPTLH